MNSFVDTNVPIGFMFSIDPLNNKSISAFREYDNIFWSNCVKKEYIKVFDDDRRTHIPPNSPLVETRIYGLNFKRSFYLL